MTHLQSALRARPHAGLIASAALLSHSTIASTSPKPVVCVLVPKTKIDDDVTLKLLAGSTMNGRYVDEAAAKKLLANMKARDEGVAPKKSIGAGKGTIARFDFKKVGLGGGMTISHHRAPQRSIGLKRRGEHLALDD